MDNLIIPEKFYYPIKLLENLKVENEDAVLRRGEQRAIALFHEMAKRVPAYKDFLKKNNIDHTKIKKINDFAKIPTIDKDNYLRKYDLEDLCWDGRLKTKRLTIAATSGSTGEPFYFPREREQDLQYAATAELYLLNNFQIHKKSTLYINGFGMGVWIGGVFTYEAIRLIAERGKYQLSIITPGSSKEEIIKAVKNLGKKFDQIIIGGYPPLVKDTIDDGLYQRLNWKEYNLKFIFSAEGFSEEFRDYIIEKAGLKNIYIDTINHYGTVDQGTIAHETPLSILIRRLSVSNSLLYNSLFPNTKKIPTLAQYNPELFYFESQSGSLLCTSASGLPLIRYDLKDQGGIYTYADVVNLLRSNGIELNKEITDRNLQDYIWKLPFVYVYERIDFTVKLSGANIYAEEIKRALQKKELQELITGKFTMQVKFDKKQDQYLEIHIELKKSIKESNSLETMIANKIIQQLLIDNSEYMYLYNHLPKKRLVPKIKLWPYENSTHFKVGGKHKWIKKN